MGCRPQVATSEGDKELHEAPPFQRPKPAGKVLRERAQPSDTRATRPARDLRGDLELIIDQALQWETKHRYATVGQMGEDLERYLNGFPVLAHKPSTTYRFNLYCRRNKLKVALMAILAAFVVLLPLSYAYATHREHQQTLAALNTSQRLAGFLGSVFQETDPFRRKEQDITVTELLDRAADRVHQQYDENPQIRASLMEAIGLAYVGQGGYERARPLLEQTLALRREGLPQDHPELAGILHNLGYLNMVSNKNRESELLFLEALKSRRQSLGENHPEVAKTHNNLGLLYSRLAQLDKAIEHYRQCLAIMDRLPEAREDIANPLHNLGYLLVRMGDFEEAEKHLQRSLEIKRATVGPDHPLTAQPLSSLGVLYVQQERPAAAEKAFRGAMSILKNLGDHPAAANAAGDLGLFLLEQERYEEAEPYCRSALEIRQKTLAPDHPYLGVAHGEVGGLALARGQLKEARIHLEPALTILEKAYGEEHPFVATTRLRIGSLERKSGNQTIALACLQKALKGFQQSKGDQRTNIISVYLEQIRLYLDMAEVVLAEETIDRALEAGRDLEVGHHRETLLQLRQRAQKVL